MNPWTSRLLLLCGAVFLLVAPFVFYPLFLIKFLCFALFACAFNLAMGTAGLLSFGHAAFFGTAAYVAAHSAKVWGWPFELAVLGGGAAAGFLGLIFGVISIRRPGIYFTMITLALAQLVYFLAVQLPFTHSEDGIQSVPRGYLFGLINLTNMYAMYFTTAGIFVIGLAIIYRVVHSPFGSILKAIRENPARATSLGFDADRFKLVAFIISAALSGVAGATKAIAFQFASLSDVHWIISGDVILMALLGGSATIFGPIIGAGLILGLDEFLAESGWPIQPIVGTIFVLCVLLFRRGILGELESRLSVRKS